MTHKLTLNKFFLKAVSFETAFFMAFLARKIKFRLYIINQIILTGYSDPFSLMAMTLAQGRNNMLAKNMLINYK